MWAGRLSILLLATTVLAGCTSSGGSVSSAALPKNSQVQASLDRYVTALASNDFEGAMRERCEGARVDAANRAQFMAEASKLLDELGAVSTTVMTPATRKIAPINGSASPVYFDYRVRGAKAGDAVLHGVAVNEGGAVRLCGYAQPDVARFADLAALLKDRGTSATTSLAQLMPTDAIEGYRVEADERAPAPADALPGRVDGWTKTWRRGSFGGARVEAIRFETPTAAAAAAKTYIDRLESDANDTFAVVGAPAVVGVRYAASAWTWIQPPHVGDQIDSTYALLGDTVVITSVAALPATADHADAVHLTTSSLGLALGQ